MNTSTPRPPKLAKKLLLAFLRDDLKEEVCGDLDEKFQRMASATSVGRATLNYWYQALQYLRPFAIKRFQRLTILQHHMFSNYLKTGVRNIFRQKGYSAINIFGLALGMSVALLIGLWIRDEITFNHNHANINRIGQVLRNGTLNGVTYTTEYLPYALADELRTKYGASFRHVLMSSHEGDHILSTGDQKITINGEFIEAGGLEMLTLNMLQGSWASLSQRNSIVLSLSLAKILYGDADPLGQFINMDGQLDAKVTGIYEDLPQNSEFAAVRFFAPWDLYLTVNQWMTTQGFTNNFLNVYVELQPSITFEAASDQIKNAIADNIADKPDFVAVNPQIHLFPMERWHLYSDWENGVNTGGLIRFVWLFGGVGSFVLLLACINFMNLSTARSDRRAREVGIRKAIGSARAQLIGQFFLESLLVVFIAFLLSLLVTLLSLGSFNDLSGKQITFPWDSIAFWQLSVGFILITSLVAGSYPALYLSSFRPIAALKGVWKPGRSAAIPRQVLVVVQFTVSVTLVIGTLVVYEQIQFGKGRPVGYDRDRLLMVPLSAGFQGKLEALETELKSSGQVQEVALSLSPTTGVWSTNGGFSWRDMPAGQQADFGTLDVTPSYGSVVGWRFAAGRDFSKELASDSLAFVLNETAASLMGFDDPVGQLVRWAPSWQEAKTFHVIGVIEDMVMNSPFGPVKPTVFFMGDRWNWMNIRLTEGINPGEALPTLEGIFRKVVPTVPFDYKFADQEYAMKFADEERIGKLAALFATLAVVISCLGLFGLASFVAEKRTKEIGIRKVVGASVYALWKMLSKDFVFLSFIACLLAIPMAFYGLSAWLQTYEYRTEIPWWIFLGTTMGAVVITLGTVSYHALKAAWMNPVGALRAE